MVIQSLEQSRLDHGGSAQDANSRNGDKQTGKDQNGHRYAKKPELLLFSANTES